MFGFIKNTLFHNYEHSTKRTDWESVLDELFLQVIHASKMGLAVISNTSRADEKDSSGIASSQLTYRIDKEQKKELKEAARMLEKEHFERLFSTRDKMKPVVFDCYRVKNPAFLRSTLIYFIEKDSKKAILLFALPLVQTHLYRFVKIISSILSRPEKRVKKVKGKAPQSFSVHQFSTIKFELLKERLNYLDGLDHLSNKEIKEMEALEDFVKKEMSEMF
ncbi:MAG: hypothetical protein HQM13_01675 [SAR324 cluster bacterium]|nr:hypothetical protein [SAR324 cluster bacterium]